MIFNSVTYLLFLVVVLCLYWVLPRKSRLWMIFLASLTFYGFWRIEYLAVLLLSCATDYAVSLQLAKTDSLSRRRWLLGVSLTVNLGLLLYFKYLVFAVDNIWFGLALLGVQSTPPVLEVVLPLGISFYTFQTVSYTIDVYRKQLEPVREFVLYGCFVTFFPQLVAGPILRSSEVTFQLDERPQFSLSDLAQGARRILAGLFLKVVMADNIASTVDAGFGQDPSSLSALDVWTLAFLFGFQIYFDFSAYSHIAIGSAKMMGIHFPENFNFPYIASSPRDFWGRWHISLSSWIRDYLYLPLTGAKFLTSSTGGLTVASDAASAAHRTRGLFLTWAIMGLWHGANWTFVFWGLYHASFVWLHRLLRPLEKRLPDSVRALVGWAITFPIMMLAWIPFRASDLGHTFTLYAKIFQPKQYLFLGMRENIYLVAAVTTFIVTAAYFVHKHIGIVKSRKWLWHPIEGLALAATVALVVVFLRPISQFIYFQF